MQISCISRAAALLLATLPAARAAEDPFFVCYSHRMEEPGNLEIANSSVTAKPGSTGNRFLGGAMELEYGLKGWWTTEVYLDAQATSGEGSLITGYRWENRFRPWMREHWINPVLYVEFEDLNGADKTMLEVVGQDGESDLVSPNQEARLERKREIEARLILGSYVRGWTVAENLIVEKHLTGNDPFEFGYAVGVSRPLAMAARPEPCRLCPENLQIGVEMFGGLGTHREFGLSGTSHYVAPALAWTPAGGTTFRISPAFGVTGSSVPVLLRFGVAWELAQAGRSVRRMLAGGRP